VLKFRSIDDNGQHETAADFADRLEYMYR